MTTTAMSGRQGSPDRQRTKEDASLSLFSVTVGEVYDGPFDLLLDLIRKQNISVYDIPIARITSQFLEYTHDLRRTDVDGAAEFILTASLLIQIKSKLLLPRDPSLSTEADGDDPRRELVDRLIEHERFKAAAAMLMERQQLEEASWTNPGVKQPLPPASPSVPGARDGYIQVDLVKVFQEVLDRIRSRPAIQVAVDEVNVEMMTNYLKARVVVAEHPVRLSELIEAAQSEQTVVALFLALLELVRLQLVLVHQPELGGEVYMKKAPGFEPVAADESR